MTSATVAGADPGEDVLPISGPLSDQLFRALADRAPLGLGLALPDGTLVYANERWRVLADFDGPTPIAADVVLDLIHPDDRDRAIETFRKALDATDERRTWCMIRSASGHHVHLSFRRIRGGDDEFLGYAVGLGDVSELISQTEELRRSEERFRSVANALPVGVFRVDRQERLIWGNERLEEISGMSVSQTEGSSIFAYTHPEDRDAVQHASRVAVREGELYESRHRIITATGDIRWVLSRSTPIRDENGRIIEFVGSLEDITEMHHASAQLAHQASHDALTELPNRASLISLIESLVRDQPTRNDLGIIFVDLDQFKEVNDTWGHQAGDAVLMEVARRLTSVIRAGDTVGRYGGDEFIVVCPGIVDTDILEEVSARIRHVISATPVENDGVSHQITASVGYALGPGTEGVDDLLHRADAAMYEAKRQR